MSLTYAFFDDLNAFSSTLFSFFSGLDERGWGGEVVREPLTSSDRETSLPFLATVSPRRFLFSNVASRRCSDACETCGKPFRRVVGKSRLRKHRSSEFLVCRLALFCFRSSRVSSYLRSGDDRHFPFIRIQNGRLPWAAETSTAIRRGGGADPYLVSPSLGRFARRPACPKAERNFTPHPSLSPLSTATTFE